MSEEPFRAPFSYREVGITRDAEGGRVPAGWHRLRSRTPLGSGPEVWAAAGEALFDWRMHRAAWVPVARDTPRAAPGVEATVVLGPRRLGLRAPCRVVWCVTERDRVGFAYGTLAGHPESGEEAFVLERDADGSVTFTVTAISRPAAWYMRAAGPLGRLARRAVARRYGRVLRRLGAAPGG
ncbi:Uncharacterized protein, UPF0548 family [Streptomyces zhaozhouensis]|uniref:Uncharacterized protein, UPF0548 family n=1 Tax=Streptomyces zhaozhouensis TaxID=1300267 RepID=A0A286DU58_9ACTN|nr:DUF1990 domain-containing protein [Streptomyces zhaozhouensis]SOD62180.1 Uncharacterized protein, UPF0548 family [Streptomyces zhaozhouensis]